MPGSEADIQNAVRLALSQAGARVFRNHVGRYRTADGRTYSHGLHPGSSDLIGWYRGLFLGVEIKTPSGRPTDAQLNFIARVNADGGIGFITSSPDDAVKQLHAIYSLRGNSQCQRTTQPA